MNFSIIKPNLNNIKKIFLALGFIASIIMSNGCFARARAFGIDENTSYKELLYCEKRHALYNQDDVVNTEAFKNATRTKQETMLEDHFKTKKAQALAWLGGKEAVKLGFIGGALIYGLSKFLQPRNHQAAVPGQGQINQPVFDANVADTMTRQTIMHMVFGSLIWSFQEKISKNLTYLWSIFADAILPYMRVVTSSSLKTYGFQKTADFVEYIIPSPQDNGLLPLEELEVRYVRSKPWLDTELQKKIEDTFIGFYCHEDNDNNDQISPKQEALLKTDVIKSAFELPTEIKPITYDEELHSKPFAGYSQAIQDVIKLFCTFHDQAQYLDQPHRYPFYFYGEPGVGKTHAAELIAKTLGLPFASITLSNLTDLMGDTSHPGKLLQAITGAKIEGKGAKNMILLIDEAEKIINADAHEDVRAFLLKFFGNKQEKTFDSPYLGMKIDISHVGIILAGNKPVECDALDDRFTSVEFPSLTTEQKQNIVETALLDKALENFVKTKQNQRFTLSKSDLSQADYDAIKKMVQEDTNPGLRSIEKNLDSYFTILSSCKVNQRAKVAQCVQKLMESIAKVSPVKKRNAVTQPTATTPQKAEDKKTGQA
jgi:hypothetical protein